jgi:hypothetical protein
VREAGRWKNTNRLSDLRMRGRVIMSCMDRVGCGNEFVNPDTGCQVDGVVFGPLRLLPCLDPNGMYWDGKGIITLPETVVEAFMKWVRSSWACPK